MQINPKTGLPYKSTFEQREAAKGYRIKGKQTIKGRAVVLLNNARSRAAKKNINVEITQEWVEKHLNRGTCEITGIPFNLAPPPKGITRRLDAPSLDRISKHKHYTENNTRVILWAVNCALAEYGTETMLPILKEMVKGIESAKEKQFTPLPNPDNWEGEMHPQHRIISTAGVGKDSDNTDHHSRTVYRQNVGDSPKEGGGDSVGHGNQEVGTSETLESVQDNWELHPTYGWIERKG